MIVQLVAAAQLAGYLCAVPVNLAFRVDSTSGLRLGAGASVFDRRAALRRAARQLKRDARRLKRDARGHRGRAPKRAWALLRVLRLDAVRLGGVIALGDAASTALACGAATALACALRARTARLAIDLRADFSSDAIRVDLRGMVSARAGQIMLAAIRALPRREGGRTHGQTSH